MGKLVPVIIVTLAIVAYFFLKEDFDPVSIRDKRVLVTGASTGIGEQLAYQYARLGARLVVTARRAELLEKVVRRCRDYGAAFVDSVPGDMAVAADRARLVSETERLLGGLDHLILNHAVFNFHDWTGAPENMTTLGRYMEIDFVSYVDVASRALSMLQSSRGNVGVVSSLAGKMGVAKSAPYSAAKHALQGFFASWRQELALKDTGISVTLCVLGLINTETAMEMIALHYVGASEDVAASAEDTASAILRSVALRDYELYYPWIANWYAAIHNFAPSLLEYYAASYLK